jgi:hypothetical protein
LSGAPRYLLTLFFLWGDLEQKFHDHFFSRDNELDLVDLIAYDKERVNLLMITSGGYGRQETDVSNLPYRKTASRISF